MLIKTLGVLAGLAIAGSGLAQSSDALKVGPYVRAEAGLAKAANPNFRDDNPFAANCFLLSVSATPPCTGTLDKLGTGWTAGVGIGYQFGGGFRAGVSYNHRAGLELKGRDPAGTDFDPPVKTDTLMFTGNLNLPVKLGPISPHIGLGLGRSKNKMDPINWLDVGPPVSRGTLTGGSKNSTAWQIEVGGDVNLPGGWMLEVGFRHTDLGKIVKHAGPDQVGSFFGPGSTTGSASGKLKTNELLVAVRYGF